jgi:hypothetical protein
MRGGSRNAIAKIRVPSAKVKIRIYATLSISQAPAYVEIRHFHGVMPMRFLLHQTPCAVEAPGFRHGAKAQAILIAVPQ